MSFAINTALYRIRKSHGLIADDRDIPEQHVGYYNKGNGESSNLKTIRLLEEKIERLETELDQYKHDAKFKSVIIRIDNNTSMETLVQLRDLLS